MNSVDLDAASQLMQTFARETGITGPGTRVRRYLWTDAFAVCTLLGLQRSTGDTAYLRLARDLASQVHVILGRYRDDDPREGWLSGLSGPEGARHPTRGGLRIGKPLPERGRHEPFDERTEWDRDGQYYHYLTRWMHALACLSRVTEDNDYLLQAVELAETAHQAFTYTAPGGTQKRMYWKMSTDLEYPTVASMGQHDALDGMLTYYELLGTDPGSDARLRQQIAELQTISEQTSLPTSDPLGLGGLLVQLYHAAVLHSRGVFKQKDFLHVLGQAARVSCAECTARLRMGASADTRLAFRELGFAIGLSAAQRLAALCSHDGMLEKELGVYIKELELFMPVRDELIVFWRNGEHQTVPSWTEHADINSVTLATALVPHGYLAI